MPRGGERARWTQEEVDLARELYKTMGPDEIAVQMGRGRSFVAKVVAGYTPPYLLEEDDEVRLTPFNLLAPRAQAYLRRMLEW